MKMIASILMGLLALGLATPCGAVYVCTFPPDYDLSVTNINGPAYVCVGGQATFGAEHDCQCPVGEESYDWSGSGGVPLGPTTKQTYTTKFPDLSYLGPQPIKVTYTITEPNGKTHSDSLSINVEVVSVSGMVVSAASLTNNGHVWAQCEPDDGGVGWDSDDPVSDNDEHPVKIKDIRSDAHNFWIEVDPESGNGSMVVRAKNPHLLAEDDKEFTVPITGCEACDTACPVGDGNFDNKCVNAIFYLGKGTRTGPAGNLQIKAETPSLDLATPRALSLIAFDPQLEIIRVNAEGGTNVLRQVLAPETFMDIVPLTTFKYEIRFYRPDQAGAKGTNGLYSPSGSPFVSYAIENPAATTNDINSLRITQTRGSAEVVYEYVYSETNGVGVCSLSSGNGLKSDVLSTVTNATGRVLTRTVQDAAGQLASKTRTTFTNFDWGAEIVERVKDPDGAALTTTRTYYDEDAIHPGQYGRLKQVNNADGSWRRLDYDPEGREILEVSSWLNAPANATPAAAHAVYSDYTPVDFQDDGSVLSHKPRTVEEKIAGTTVSKTFAAYYFSTNNPGERVEIEERAASAAASYGTAGNLRTTRIYYPVAPGQPDSAQFKSVTSPDGRLDSYFYEAGEYAVGTFTANPTGTYTRVAVVHGTVGSPNGIPFKTTEEVFVNDRFGRTLLQETYVSTPSGSQRIAWTQFTLDEFGREISRQSSNGTLVDSAWSCCGKESEKDENGIERLYAYDALKRLVFSKKVGVAAGEYPAQADQISTYTYDAEGRRLTEVLSAGSLSQSRTNQYDLAGRRTESTDFAGRKTFTSYSQDGLTVTETLPGGLTRITERFKDGQIKSITGTAQIPQFHEYGVNADGTKWTKIYSASDGSPVWVKTTTDLLGKTAKVERPGYSATEVTESFYNSKDQLVKTTTTGRPDTLYAHDEIGNQIRLGLDINGNGSLDLAGTDRINESDSSYMSDAFGWWRQTVSRLYATDNSADIITSSITRQRLTGLGGALSSATVSIDALGNETITTTTIDRNAKKVTQTTDVPDSSANIVSISVNGLIQSSTTAHSLQPTVYFYDSLGRRTRSETLGGTRSVASVTHYDSHGWVAYTEDAAGNRTTFTYDPATGRGISKTDPLSNTTYFAFTALGEVEKTWGSAAYPVSFEYDAYNRRVKQHTYRNGSGWSGPTWPATPGGSDETTWTYQEATGLLLNKTDDAGKSVSYTYTVDSKLETRTWARTHVTNSLVTTYTYNSAGDLTGLDYSDGTPDVSFTYDRLGRQKTAESSVSSHEFAYNGLLLDSETIVSSSGTNIIDRSYDSYGRSTGFTIGNDYSVAYGYDSYGRFSSVSSSVSSASICGEYSYLANSDLIETLSTDNGLLTTRSYEPNRNLLTQVKNTVDSQTISQFDYSNDALGRRTLVKNSGTGFQPVGNAFNLYAYNSRSEVISAERFFGSDPQSPGAPVAGQNWDYDYDPIGNRKTAARDGDTEIYTANNLNQYTERTVSGTVPLSGTAAEDATVTINRPTISGITVEPVTRQGAYFHKKLALDNSSRADVEEIAVVGVKAGAGTNGTDIVSTYSGVVWAAQSPEQFSYDDDGNQLSDALRRYEWDAENRLIAVTSSNVVDGSLTKVEFTYDYMSRRASKTVYAWSAASNEFQISSFSTFIYDGWNLIKEISTIEDVPTGLPASRVIDYYIWGLDLSGSLQGAGGIGGLLSRIRKEERFLDDRGLLLICHRPPGNPENYQTIRINASAWPAHEAHGDTLGSCAGAGISNSAFFYTFDGNGNVSELLGTVNGELGTVGHFEYSPFGETIVAVGSEAFDNPFQFSTKYWDSEVALNYYGYRYYSPSLGRWLSRDPIGEKGEQNLYVAIANSLLNKIDSFGLLEVFATDDGFDIKAWGQSGHVGINGGSVSFHKTFWESDASVPLVGGYSVSANADVSISPADSRKCFVSYVPFRVRPHFSVRIWPPPPSVTFTLDTSFGDAYKTSLSVTQTFSLWNNTVAYSSVYESKIRFMQCGCWEVNGRVTASASFNYNPVLVIAVAYAIATAPELILIEAIPAFAR